ncbi:restriction endonuclease subunit S [Halomonas sp. HP20-15]|uniref:restriction endonuclease subunit S n=1 Tax=Halomonas sp. HP20-15 TaxID=3085901 RepID=UPI002981ABE6|nr:restriction endonuclease subunit S [Halomonas sp. HP20-15]MDW5375847.1 restriction endonuclease subunit S [Halomonas sp. HP20-15]
MSSEWITIPLGKVLTLQRGHDLPAQDRVAGGVPILGSSGITGYHNESKASGPGVTVGRSGNAMGEINYSDKGFWPLNTALYVTDFKGNDPKFVYYLLKTIDFDQFNSGSAQKSLNRNAVYPFEVKIPRDFIEQRAISSVLSLLEDKIEINHQINQTLEQMAQALFKSWFVDFEPVKAKIAARQRWQALQPENEPASPGCYAAELDGQSATGGLESYMNRAAMQAIAGKTAAQLDALRAEDPERYQEFYKTVALFPSAMQASELGEIPEGWETGSLSDLIDFNPRRTLRKGELAPYLDMKNVPTSGHLAEEVVQREMGSGTKFINGDTLLARITPCLENGKTAFVDFLEDGETGWGSTEYIILRPTEAYPKSLGYFIARDESFRSAAIQSMTGTSGRQRADAKSLSGMKWLIYPPAIVGKFDLFASSYLRLARNYGDQNKVLSKTRDALLPELLSGNLTCPVLKE